MSPHTAPPEGFLTFLFTDVEGSTRLWAGDTAGTAASFEIHDELIRSISAAHEGFVFGFAGDGFRACFQRPDDALKAAVEITEQLATAPWAPGPELKVRIGLHSGESTMRGAEYFGPTLNTAARIEDAGHGGQILMSADVARSLSDTDFELLWLGKHRLKDIATPVGIYQYGPASHPPLRVVNPKLSNLPNLGDSIVGRENLVGDIRGMMEAGGLVTLTGPGGCGKTRLGIEVAYQELPNRTDGCYFADLVSVSEAESMAGVVAGALKLTLGAGDPVTQIVDHLANRNALLLLDNCEHLIEACADLAERLLGRAGTTAILATSRERLDVSGERVIAVAPLEVRHDGGPAVEVFERRAQLVNPDFTVDSSNLAEVVQLCKQLDGLPLAIELAAARMSVLSVKELSSRMGDRLRLLTGNRTGGIRRQTMQATLDWSYDLLTPSEQQFFRTLGVFVGPFSLDAATAIASDGDELEAMDLLDSLVGKSLVSSTQDGDTRNFRLLETIRFYARDHLHKAGQLAEARQNHLEYFYQLARPLDWVEGSDCTRARDFVMPMWSNVTSALEWAVTTESYLMAGGIALGCQGAWSAGGLAALGVSILTELVEPTQGIDLELGQWLELNLAQLYLQLDNFPEVHRIFKKMSDEALPKPRSQALAMRAFTMNRTNPEGTLEALRLGDELISAEGLSGELASATVWSRGNYSLYEGNFVSARELFGESFDLMADRPVLTLQYVATGLSYAAAQVLTGQPAEALETLDSEDWSPCIFDSSAVVRVAALLDLGRVAEAATLIVEFSWDALRGRLNRMPNDALIGWAALAISRGDDDHAWQLLQQAITPRTPFTIGLAEGLAGRIGKESELRRLHRERLIPLDRLDASVALQNELARTSGVS